MNESKIDFIRTELFSSLQELSAETPASWGKMNSQQMVEHLADFFDVSSGKLKFDLVTPEEQLPIYKSFLHSEKEFRENTKAPVTVLGDDPLPLRKASLEEAIEGLQVSVDDFFICFKPGASVQIIHPVFGPLNFDEWVLLHYKHVTHHLRQFGLQTL